MRQRLQSFMAGRYGSDELNTFLWCIAAVLSILFAVCDLSRLMPIVTVLLLWTIFRMFSRRTDKRSAENHRFLLRFYPIRDAVAGWFSRTRQLRDYRFFTCPGCHSRLRVPRGKGHIQITCPRCGHRFSGKT